jgi:NADH-quinone oxidoreductase subunit N
MGANLLFTLPELILSAGAIVLMLVAAWSDEGSTETVSILAVALLVAAGFAAALPITGYGVATGPTPSRRLRNS